MALAAGGCTGQHRLRLFVGEGNFSYTEALINKHRDRHNNLGESIISTELITRERYENSGRTVFLLGADDDESPQVVNEGEKDTLDRIERLENDDVAVFLGVDATKLHEWAFLNGRQVSRIHWNLPLNDQSDGSFANVLADFFSSCRKIQQVGDRIYITLLQGENKVPPKNPGFAEDWIFQQGYKAEIALCSAARGYKLITKRNFVEKQSLRYEGYVTRNSFSGKELKPEQIEHIREFVFEQQQHRVKVEELKTVEQTVQVIQEFTDPAHEKIEIKTWDIRMKGERESTSVYYFDCPTDNDSSEYSASASDSE